MPKPLGRGELIDKMRRWGVRVTAQRLAVAEVLVGSSDHPTAPEVYERVQARFPHITIGTIYNAINVLARTGLVQPLSFSEATRYDANPSPHANLVCVHCRTIRDEADSEGWVGRLREQVAGVTGFQVMSQRVDFYGVCPDCAETASGKPESLSNPTLG